MASFISSRLSLPTMWLLTTLVMLLGRNDKGTGDCFASAEAGIVTFGYIRMPFLDPDALLAGYYSTIHHANAIRDEEDLFYVLNVTTIPCSTVVECKTITPEMEDLYIKPFMKAMSGYAAVFRPNYVLAPIIIDHATALGGLPVIAPTTVRKKDFSDTARHVINFNRNIASELAHVFTYMRQNGNCAFSGILYEDFSELTSYIPAIQKMFTDGGLPVPEAIDFMASSSEELVRYFAADTRRQCYLLLLTRNTAIDVTARIINEAQYLPEDTKFYGTSLTSGAHFAINGESWMFTNLHLLRWSPSIAGQPMQATTDIRTFHETWRADAARPDPERALAASIIADTDDGLLMSYLMMQFVIDAFNRLKMENGAAIRAFVRNHTATHAGDAGVNISGKFFIPIMNMPPQWERFLLVLYNNPRSIGDFPLIGRMAHTCPIKVLTQECFCNNPTSTSFVFRVNGTTGIPYELYDGPEQSGRMWWHRWQ